MPTTTGRRRSPHLRPRSCSRAPRRSPTTGCSVPPADLALLERHLALELAAGTDGGAGTAREGRDGLAPDVDLELGLGAVAVAREGTELRLGRDLVGGPGALALPGDLVPERGLLGELAGEHPAEERDRAKLPGIVARVGNLELRLALVAAEHRVQRDRPFGPDRPELLLEVLLGEVDRDHVRGGQFDLVLLDPFAVVGGLRRPETVEHLVVVPLDLVLGVDLAGAVEEAAEPLTPGLGLGPGLLGLLRDRSVPRARHRRLRALVALVASRATLLLLLVLLAVARPVAHDASPSVSSVCGRGRTVSAIA